MGSKGHLLIIHLHLFCRKIHTLIGHRGEISSAQFNYDCSLIATGSMDKTCKIWDTGSGKCIGTLRGHEDEILDVVFDYTGQYIASASADSKLHTTSSMSTFCFYEQVKVPSLVSGNR